MKKDIVKFIKSKDFKFVEELGRGACGKTVKLYDEVIDEYFVCKKYEPYFEEYKKTHEGQKYANSFYGLMMPPALTDAFTNVMMQGLPLGQVSLEDALDMMEEARLSLDQ